MLNATPGEPLARVLPHQADLDAAAALLTVGQRVAILVGRARGAPRRRSRRWPTGWAPGWPPPCRASRCSTSGCRSTPGCSVRSAPPPPRADGRRGHPAAGGHQRPVDRLPPDARPEPGPCRSTSTGDGSAADTRWTCRWSATPPRPCARCWPRSPTGPTGSGGPPWRAPSTGGAWRPRPAPPSRPSRSTRQLVLPDLSPGCPARLSPWTSVRCSTGTPALELPPGVSALCGALGSLGCAVPCALAAKLDRPDKPVVALLGDGAMQLNGLAELITVAHRWQEWADPRLVVLVLNEDAGPLRGWATAGGCPGVPGRRADVLSPVGPGCSACTASRWSRPELSRRGLGQGLAADRPCVLEAVVDPTVSLAVPGPGPGRPAEPLRRRQRPPDASGTG